MELEGLKRALRFLAEQGNPPAVVVTDRHASIKKYMREQQPTIRHQFDVWHVAKGMYTIVQTYLHSTYIIVCTLLSKEQSNVPVINSVDQLQ